MNTQELAKSMGYMYYSYGMPRIHRFLKHSFMIDNFLERCICIWRKKVNSTKIHEIWHPTKSKYDSLKTVCLFLESYKRYRLFTGYMEHVHRADEDHALLVNIADHSHSLTHGCKSRTQVTQLTLIGVSLTYGCTLTS